MAQEQRDKRRYIVELERTAREIHTVVAETENEAVDIVVNGRDPWSLVSQSWFEPRVESVQEVDQ